MNVGRHLERLHMTKIQPGADPKVAFDEPSPAPPALGSTASRS